MFYTRDNIFENFQPILGYLKIFEFWENII